MNEREPLRVTDCDFLKKLEEKTRQITVLQLTQKKENIDIRNVTSRKACL